MSTMLTVRELSLADIPLIADYWSDSSEEHLLNMGVELNKMPERSQFIEMLTKQYELPIEQKSSYCTIWEDDGKPIGHCNTNPTTFGEEAFMHLHLWNAADRKSGAGTALVRLSLQLFFENLRLKRIFSQPYALNDAPNRTLEKAGFNFIKEYTTIPGSLSFEQPAKLWEMSIDRFKQL